MSHRVLSELPWGFPAGVEWVVGDVVVHPLRPFRLNVKVGDEPVSGGDVAVALSSKLPRALTSSAGWRTQSTTSPPELVPTTLEIVWVLQLSSAWPLPGAPAAPTNGAKTASET